MSLTKSLHTVTAVANVARYQRRQRLVISRDAYVLAKAALAVLGYDITGSVGDETVQRCVAACARVIAEA